MKLKKLLIPSMGAVAIVAPVATLVACGSSKGVEPDWQVGNDLATTNTQLFNKLVELSKTDNSSFKMEANNLFERVVNSETYGMLDVVRLQDINGNSNSVADFMGPQGGVDIDGMIDTSVVVNGKPQTAGLTIDQMLPVYKNSNSFWNKHVKKSELLTSASLEQVANEVKNIIDTNPNDKFGVLVVEDTEDKDDVTKDKFVSGEYTIHLFKMKKNATTSVVTKAEALFKDTTKFGQDEKRIKDMGGSYVLSYAYGFKSKFSSVQGTDKLTSQDIWGTQVTPITHSDSGWDVETDIYKDRTNESNLSAYYGFGPLSSVDQATMDLYKDMETVAYPIQDNKTKEWKLILTSFVKGIEPGFAQDLGPVKLQTKKLNELSSIAIPMPLLNNFASTKTYPTETMKDLIVNKMSFDRVYDEIVNKVSKDLLKNAPYATSFVQDLFKIVPYMYQSKPLLNDASFLEDFIKNVKSFDTTFDVPTFTQVLEWMGDKTQSIGDFATFGAKRQSLITMLPRFYKDVEKFVSSKPDYAKRLYKLEDIKATPTK